MLLALIPPNCLANRIEMGTINLLLPWQLTLPEVSSPTVRNRYTILDNGAAERRLASWNTLARLLIENDFIDEVVIPDKLRDASFTLKNAFDARQLLEVLDRPVKVMAVVQGKTLAQIMKCVAAYAAMEHIDIIGIPRVLNEQFGRLSRLRLCESLAADRDYADLQLHCLGSYYTFPNEAVHLTQLPNVRSFDTSLPWVYGLVGKLLTDKVPKGIKRPKDYFIYDHLTQLQEATCDDNVDILRSWTAAQASPR